MSGPLALPPSGLLIVLEAARGVDQLVARFGSADRITTRKPDDVDEPWAVVRSAGGFSMSARRGAWTRLVQLEVCATRPVAGELPELFCERTAYLAATVLDGVSGVHGGASWSCRHVDGPNDLTDSSRGGDAPVFKQGVRFDVRIHAHT